jgi:hypothetical protein
MLVVIAVVLLEHQSANVPGAVGAKTKDSNVKTGALQLNDKSKPTAATINWLILVTSISFASVKQI